VPDWSEITCRFPPKSPAAFDRNRVPVCSDFCSDCRVHKLPAHRFEAFKSSFFIGPHKPRIAGHIGGENRGEAALDGLLHGTLGIGNYSKTALLAAPENERGGSAFRASRSILPNTFTRSLNPPPQMFSLLLEAEIVLPTMEPVDRGETSVSG
jgi:hypothetical protein